ncbi:serine/threonine-protein kinase pelle isoform X3 [Bicyclus anynana]|uniref:Serine/threonine-protein kinase pelle isoform X3 n=1 Tax=Bicyclus anynana TaxID=110368 RepID=A0ABM3M0N2_BICAN|nr:serine/threonine-protein kinase pelle isoform X3 [Bicyclus anynana]
MYIYELPYDINKELCRLLDNDEDWKELAGHMKYSAFDVNEIQQIARRQETSPTGQLLTQWSQLNHKVEELFMLLYHMKHITALRCLTPVVDKPFHRLLQKHDSKTVKDKHPLSYEGNLNKQKTQKVHGSDSSGIPLPVMLFEERRHVPVRSEAAVTTHTDTSITDSSKNTSSTQGKPDILDDEFLRQVSAIPMLKYEDLKEATNNWSESNLLGRGGFGQVFKGEWKLSLVAVKKLSSNDAKNKELIREMCLNQYRHDNILPLYGYSLGGPEACLVYQFMAGGSLEQRLRHRSAHPPLSWSQRYRIAHGVARGLQFLHTMAGTPLIHGDIKPANILLDQCVMPKIGDFGLARKGPYGDDRTHLKVSRVHGTRPYLPDEYLRSRVLSPAVDVFSFGVLLLEMATALPAADRARAAMLLSDHAHQLARDGVDYATLEDRSLAAIQDSSPQMCREFVRAGLLCTERARRLRPAMSDVYRRLDALQLPGKHVA